ncbi:hypothetical protein PVAND_002002 [Polypedilum vanderplanki]|uniref:B3/B4 tRNA-binding domain-containing protein n=1 Tax=Polypedilum vanderplanki TaxID=319348 RepID=A0A9J6BQW7_POLVA|nr:hypothetical protein PVAND_002002 [Polypedilum vanderplanki]
MEKAISSVKAEKRRELILNGAILTESLDTNNGKVNETLFKLNQLHLLRLSESTLSEIDGEKLNNLTELHSLLLFGNRITIFPEINRLINLKNLDLSGNKITSVNADLSNLMHLSAVNISNNELSSFHIKSSSIRNLNLSRNKLEKFPENLPISITELYVSKNEIKDIPMVMNLPNLKILDLSENKITAVPKSLASIKFKTLNLKDNPLKDKKLFKFIDQNQSLKAIIDHIQKLGISSESSTKENDKKQTKSESEQKMNEIVIKKFEDDFKIDYDPSVKDVRNFILCCIVNNLQFTPSNMKDFLQFQTKLHDTTCKKRELATIATHDLDLINSKNLRYAAKHKDDVKIQPLNRGDKMYTGSEYFEILKQEADSIRKEKKRSQVTGVYKFLQLLEDKSHFAILETDTGVCLSLPPLTNSENTKMSLNTKRLLIEVTSHHCAAICNKVMSELVSKLNDMNHVMEINTLELQQVKIVVTDGSIKTLYPSKIDLNELENSTTKIIRP